MVKTKTSPVGESPKAQGGFTYLMALAGIAMVSILAAVGYEQTSVLMQREREKELLFRGIAYRNAIGSYYNAGRERAFPRHLVDLLQDGRSAHHRHMRTLYPDPFTGGPWEIVRGVDGGIVGVRSRSRERPFKQKDFPPGLEALEGSETYAGWLFEYRPPPTPPPPRTKSGGR